MKSINLVKVISDTFNTFKQRVVKVYGFGIDDVKTALETGPYGLDSNPIKGMIAIYSQTADKGERVIIGYINKNQKAQPGEFRTFATDASGGEIFYTWMKSNGTMELGGSIDNLIRYTALNTALQAEVVKINAELVKIAAGVNAIVPGSYVVTPVTLDISLSKINELKTP